MDAFLTVTKDRQMKGTYPLIPGKVISIGRSHLNDICLIDPEKPKSDSFVSRFHAAVIPDKGGKYLLQDLGSRNGIYTLSTKNRINYHQFVTGDCVTIGEYELLFREKDRPQDTAVRDRVIIDKIGNNNTKTRLEPMKVKDRYIENLPTDKQTLTLLYQMIHLIVFQKDLELACRVVVKGLKELVGAERAFIALVGLKGEIEKCIARFPENATVKISRTLLNHVIEKKEPLIIENALKDDRLQDNKGKPKGSVLRLNTLSAVCVPFIVQNKVKGILYVDTSQKGKIQIGKEQTILQFFAKDLSAILEQQLANKLLAEENSELKRKSQQPTDIIVGNSPQVKKIQEDIKIFGKTNATVFIFGESGTGKELIARALHEFSPRRNKPFFELNCACLVESILESQLFGVIPDYPGFHNKEGMFGIIQQADGGTLFLDEIDELGLAIQGKLLKVMEDHIVTPLGGKPEVVDVRIISATNKDIRKKVKDGTFRADLFQRMNFVELGFPPLRERREDIPLLAGYFLAKQRQEFGNVGRLTYESMDYLMEGNWLGNLRELKNCIGRATIKAAALGLEEITPDLLLTRRIETEELKSLEEIEKEYIIRILKHTDNNREKAYKILGISRATLFNKIKEYGLQGFEE